MLIISYQSFPIYALNFRSYYQVCRTLCQTHANMITKQTVCVSTFKLLKTLRLWLKDVKTIFSALFDKVTIQIHLMDT